MIAERHDGTQFRRCERLTLQSHIFLSQAQLKE